PCPMKTAAKARSSSSMSHPPRSPPLQTTPPLRPGPPPARLPRPWHGPEASGHSLHSLTDLPGNPARAVALMLGTCTASLRDRLVAGAAPSQRSAITAQAIAAQVSPTHVTSAQVGF